MNQDYRELLVVPNICSKSQAVDPLLIIDIVYWLAGAIPALNSRTVRVVRVVVLNGLARFFRLFLLHL